MSRKEKRTAESCRPRELFATVWPLVLEVVFLGAFFLCRELVEGEGVMPEALAIAFLTVIATDVLAAVLKLRAVRYREGDGTLSPLPQSLIAVIVFSVLRVAVLGAAVIGAVMAIAGKQSDSTYNLLIAAVVVKELLLLWLLRPRRTGSVPKRMPLVVEMVADLNLTIVGVFPALLLSTLFVKPMLDLAWNLLFFGVMILLCLFLSFLLLFPFRRFSAFEPSTNSDQAEKGGLSHFFGSVAVAIFVVWPLIYDSDDETEQMHAALAARPSAAEFVYAQPSRLKSVALEELCEQPELRRLELHTEHTGYLPPCVFERLTELDVSGNDFSMLKLNRATGLVSVDASHNKIGHIYELSPAVTVRILNLSHNRIRELDSAIYRFEALAELDLSHNPLDALPADLHRLENLRVVRLEGTGVTGEALEELRRVMPSTRFEL